jgi:hypothetical protein
VHFLHALSYTWRPADTGLHGSIRAPAISPLRNSRSLPHSHQALCSNTTNLHEWTAKHSTSNNQGVHLCPFCSATRLEPAAVGWHMTCAARPHTYNYPTGPTAKTSYGKTERKQQQRTMPQESYSSVPAAPPNTISHALSDNSAAGERTPRHRSC